MGLLNRFGSKLEQSAASKAEQIAAQEAEDAATRAARQGQIEDTFSRQGDYPTNTDAAQSAKTFNDNAPNFDTVGEPYGSNYPTKQPGPVPATTDNSNLPAVIGEDASQGANQASRKSLSPEMVDEAPAGMRDVGSSGGGGGGGASGVPDSLNPQLPGRKGNSMAPSLGLLGLLGLGGAGMYAMMPDDDKQSMVMGSPANSMNKAKNPNPDLPISGDDEDDDVSPVSKSKKSGGLGMPSSSITPQQKPNMTLNFGNQTNPDTVAGLKDAQQRQSQAVLANELGRSADLIGASIAGSGAKPVAQDAFKSNIADAQNIVKNYQDQIAKQKEDPNSPVSQGMKSFLQNMGYKVQGSPSAADMEKMFPIAEKYSQHLDDVANRQMLAKMHSDDLRYHYAALNNDKQNKLDAKQQLDQEKAYTEMQNKMEGGRGTNPAVNQAFIAVKAADTANNLLQDPKWANDLNKMPSEQVNMLRAELAKMVQGGVATEGGRHELATETLRSNFSRFLQKVNNQPTGAQLGAFIQQNADYINGMRQVNVDRINDYRANTYQAYKTRIGGDHIQDTKDFYPEAVSRAEATTGTMDKIKAKIQANPGMSVDDAKQSVIKDQRLQTQLKPQTKDQQMVKTYNSMDDSDQRKAPLGKILRAKGLLKATQGQ